MRAIYFYILLMLSGNLYAQNEILSTPPAELLEQFRSNNSHLEVEYIRSDDPILPEFFCPNDCNNINFGILIGAAVTNCSDDAQTVSASISSESSFFFFQSIGDFAISDMGSFYGGEMIIKTGQTVLFAAQLGAQPGLHELNISVEQGENVYSQTCNTEIRNNFATDVEITKVVNDTSPTVGDTIYYTLTIKNIGSEPAETPDVFEFIPEELKLISMDCVGETVIASTGQGCRIAESLSPGDSVEIKVTTEVLFPGEIVNRATVSTCSFDENQENNIVEETIVVEELDKTDISVTKTIVDGLYFEGDTLQYLVEIKNEGDERADQVTILDSLPSNIKFASATCSDGGIVQLIEPNITCTWASLDPGQLVTALISVLTTEDREYKNCVFRVENNTYEDTDPSNDTSCATLHTIPFVELQIEQYSFIEPFDLPCSTEGSFVVEFQPAPQPRFLNVFMINPETSTGSWVIQNGRFYPTLSTQIRKKEFAFNFADLGFEDGSAIEDIIFQVEVTDQLLFDFPLNSPQFNLPVIKNEIHIFNGIEDEFIIPPFEEVPPPDIIIDKPDSCFVDRIDTTLNIDLDKAGHAATGNEYAGDQNACAPTSVANAFDWLESQGYIDPTVSSREKLEEISAFMKRDSAKGVFAKQWVEGKLGFIDKYRLPISVQYQSVLTSTDSTKKFFTPDTIKSPNPNTNHIAISKDSSNESYPTWEFLIKAMKENKAVELDYVWIKREHYEVNGQPQDSVVKSGAHAVVVSQASEIAGTRKVTLLDDGDQCAEGGLRTREFTWNFHNGRPYLEKEVNRHGNFSFEKFVRGIIVQCPDAEVTHFVADLLLQFTQPDAFPIITDEGKIFVEFVQNPEGEFRLFNVRTNEFLNPNVRKATESWLQRNIVLPPSNSFDTLGFWLSTGNSILSEANEKDSFRFDIQVGNEVVTTDSFDVLFRPTIQSQALNINQPSGSNSPSEGTIEFPILKLPTFNEQDKVSYYLLPRKPKVIDLDSTQFDDWTNAGQGVIAGALHSIKELGSFSTFALREKYNQVKSFLPDNTLLGVSREELIKSVLELIDSFQIQASVSFQSIEFGQDSIPSPNPNYGHFAINENQATQSKLSWDRFKEQLNEDNPIICELGYYDENGDRKGGHWVIAIGYTEVGNVKSFYYLDDLDQSQSGGLSTNIVYWNEDDFITYISSLSTTDYVVRIETVMSIQFDESVEFNSTSSQQLLLEDFLISPNPAQTEIKVSGMFKSTGSYQIELLDVLGKVYKDVKRKTSKSVFEEVFDLRGLVSGIYFVKVSQLGRIGTFKIVVQ